MARHSHRHHQAHCRRRHCRIEIEIEMRDERRRQWRRDGRSREEMGQLNRPNQMDQHFAGSGSVCDCVFSLLRLVIPICFSHRLMSRIHSCMSSCCSMRCNRHENHTHPDNGCGRSERHWGMSCSSRCSDSFVDRCCDVAAIGDYWCRVSTRMERSRASRRRVDCRCMCCTRCRYMHSPHRFDGRMSSEIYFRIPLSWLPDGVGGDSAAAAVAAAGVGAPTRLAALAGMEWDER